MFETILRVHFEIIVEIVNTWGKVWQDPPFLTNMIIFLL